MTMLMPLGKGAEPAGMADVKWKTVVDMEMHNFRVDISDLKAAVAKVGAIIIGFREQM
jgi:hypothetical protein